MVEELTDGEKRALGLAVVFRLGQLARLERSEHLNDGAKQHAHEQFEDLITGAQKLQLPHG